MKLRFKVDQANCFREGVDCPKSIFDLEVHPKDLKQEHRTLIADHLCGISVVNDLKTPQRPDLSFNLVESKLPTLESLIEALTILKGH